MTTLSLLGIVPDLPEASYHARPELSSTGARRLLESPAKFRWAQTHPVFKETFDVGSAIHKKVLGTGSNVIELDFPDWRTAAARAARDEARANGDAPILVKDMVEINACAEAVLAHPKARSLLEQATARMEASVFATDPTTGVDIRARFDVLADVSADLKTTVDASPKGFAKSAASYGYHVQQAHYLDALQLVTGERRPFTFIAVEKEPPYLVGVYMLDVIFTDMGITAARVAREIFAECSASDVWPGYSDSTQLLMPPVWATYDHQDRFETEEMVVE